MMRWLQGLEERLEKAAAACADAIRFVADVADRDVLARLGPRGMAAVTLPMLALCQALLGRWSLLGGATVPLLWCAVAYYVLRFRPSVSLWAAGWGAVLAWLASRCCFWSAGVLLFVVAAGCGVLRRWLYAEFWPAHACASMLMALAVPGLAAAAGLPSPVPGLRGFLGTLLLAPMTGAVLFSLLERFRKHLGVQMEFPQEEDPRYDPSYLYPPYAARRHGV